MTKALIAVAISAALLRLAESDSEPLQPRSSSIATTPDGNRLVVVNPDSGSVSIVDARGLTKLAELPVCDTPATVAVSGESNRAFVACRDGFLVAINLTDATLTSRAGEIEPFGVVEHEGRLFVSDTASAQIRVLDADSLAEIAAVAVEGMPRGLTLDPVRGRLFVTHFLTGRISVIDLSSLAVVSVMSTGIDSNLSESITLSANGERLFAPLTRSNAGNPALLFDTTVFPIVAVLDLESLLDLPKERLSIDVVDRPVNMPADAVATTDGTLYVAHAGSDDLSVIDMGGRKTVAHLPLGSNPRGLALSPDERFVYVTNTLSGTVSVIDTTTDTVTATIIVTTIPLNAALLNGKRLFHSSATTRLAKDRWISCATCHPDGGMDGRTWFFRDGPRNTPSLFGVASTLPMHWSGDLDELQDVESTIRIVQAGSGLADGDVHCTPACDRDAPNGGRSRDLDDLARFMASLRPLRHHAEPSDASRRGERLFLDPNIGCVSCHPPLLYTDRRKHDVGTGGPHERKGNAFDTPSLRGVFGTPPYLHDGSAATLGDAVRRHGNGSSLTPTELEDVVAFLRTITFQQPRRASVRH